MGLSNDLNLTRLPWLRLSENRVIDIGDTFISLTEYEHKDLVGKSLTEVFKLLRISPINSKDNKGSYYYLFTQSYELREVEINCKNLNIDGHKIYTFREKEDSRLDTKFKDLEQFYSDNVFSLAIHSVPDMILLRANESYLNSLGEPFNKKENSLGKKHQEIVKNYDYDEKKKFWTKVLAGGVDYHEYEVRFNTTHIGETYWDIAVVPIYEDSKIKYLIEAATNITEQVLYRKTIQNQAEMIKKQNLKLQAIFDNSADILLEVDSYGKFNMINERAKKLFKCDNIKDLDELYSLGDFYNTSGKKLKHEELVCLVVGNEKELNSVKCIINGDDEEIYIDLTRTPIFDDYGNFVSSIIVGHDVTHRVLESKKIEDQKNELENIMKKQGEFFSFIAHEFRTPLTTMNSTLQLLDLVYSKEMTSNIKKYMNTLKRSTFQQLRLVNNLLDITRAEAGYLKVNKQNYEIVSMTKAIMDSIKPYALAKNIQLKYTADFIEKRTALDDEKYERILLNLISNAIKFTPKNKDILIKLFADNERVYISITDSGIGIPKDKQAVIFERFGQTNSKRSRENEGTGIGLYLVKLLVESMGGNITLVSEENKGTKIIIGLPDDIVDDTHEEEITELTNNRLVESLNMEFSNIYFE